jgi:hypothetical protein
MPKFPVRVYARYFGRCPQCGGTIAPGMEIAPRGDGRWIHVFPTCKEVREVEARGGVWSGSGWE